MLYKVAESKESQRQNPLIKTRKIRHPWPLDCRVLAADGFY